MAIDKARQVVLLSIKPQFAEAILSGTKRVEFRRTRCRSDLAAAIIYVTAPTKRILGYFEIGHVEEMSPSAAWRRYHAVGGISRSAFDLYYAGAERAVVIGVGRVVSLPREQRLSALGSASMRPPQSLQYLGLPSLLKLDPDFAPGGPDVYTGTRAGHPPDSGLYPSVTLRPRLQ